MQFQKDCFILHNKTNNIKMKFSTPFALLIIGASVALGADAVTDERKLGKASKAPSVKSSKAPKVAKSTKAPKIAKASKAPTVKSTKAPKRV
jgi:hypothetical protein